MAGGSVNKVILVGNVGKDPEVRAMQTGKEMANFTLATSESWTDKSSGAKTEKTEWHNVVVFNEGLVRVVRDYVHKGSKIYLEGSLRTRKWTDQNSNDRYTTEVVLQGFNAVLVMLDSKNSASAAASSSSNQSLEPTEYDDLEMSVDDDIPF